VVNASTHAQLALRVYFDLFGATHELTGLAEQLLRDVSNGGAHAAACSTSPNRRTEGAGQESATPGPPALGRTAAPGSAPDSA
jgi:hypothetical protein